MQVRRIKKYPNRRLYDTGVSCYISNDDVRDLIVSGELVNIIDSKTGADITRSVLMNIIAEDELAGATAVLTQKMLADLIKFEDQFLAGILGVYLEQSLDFFIKNQMVFRHLMKDFDAQDPLVLIGKLLAQQEEMLEREQIDDISQ